MTAKIEDETDSGTDLMKPCPFCGSRDVTLMTGEVLKQQRQKLGLTLQQVAEGVGVSNTSILYWERGDRTPKAEHRLALAAFFDQVGSNHD